MSLFCIKRSWPRKGMQMCATYCEVYDGFVIVRSFQTLNFLELEECKLVASSIIGDLMDEKNL